MRVSTEGDRQSTDLQHDALIRAGIYERHIFEEKASGSKDDRVDLAQALEYVKEGDVLVVWKLDRLGRSLSHLIEIVSHLKSKGVGFKSLTEGMDTSSPSGELLFHVFGALAQFERSLIQERINAGLTEARKRGRIGGRPRAIPQEKVDAILKALDNGMSKAAIFAERLRLGGQP